LCEREKPVYFTRSRPYKKNDNAHVEQKNWTNVRQLLGYERLDVPAVAPLLNDLYRTEWRQFQNFFCPSFKRESKQRVGGQVKKKYGIPQTPYARTLACPKVKETDKEELRSEFARLNPFELKRQIERKLKRIFTVNREEKEVLPAAERNEEFNALIPTVESRAQQTGGGAASPVETSQRVGSSGAQVALPQSPILRPSGKRLRQRRASSK
jgi:hypothetical protein